VGSVAGVSHWVLDTSVFQQMASAPAVSPRWGTDGVMVLVGAACAAAGAVALQRRDLAGP